MPTQTEVIDALRKVTDPELGPNLVELNMIHDLAIAQDGSISFTIALTAPGCHCANRWHQMPAPR
jgi:metal-sulfur cluster biosynthetic enzyme